MNVHKCETQMTGIQGQEEGRGRGEAGGGARGGGRGEGRGGGGRVRSKPKSDGKLHTIRQKKILLSINSFTLWKFINKEELRGKERLFPLLTICNTKGTF